jgi:hypothetical protein
MKVTLNEVDKLKDELIWAFYDLHQYKKIYKSDNEKLLEETAANFFYDLKYIFIDRFILSISRLTDLYEDKYHNLSLSIDILVKFSNENKLKCANVIKQNIHSVKEKAKPFRIHRNKRVAHKDMKIENVNQNLEIGNVNDIYDMIGDCINKIYFEVKNINQEWRMTTTDDADFLIKYLELGKKKLEN